MGGRTHIIIVVLAATCAARAALADPPVADAPADSSAVLTLPPVEVPAARASVDRALRVRPGFARAYDVALSYGRLRMVSDLLAGAVGVHVRQLGGAGSFSAISIRGAPSSQVAVYLDGVPLNSPQYGVVDVSDLPIEALSRIEVDRGPAPLGFDSPGGGVIQLVTRQAQDRWARVSMGGGSYETGKADLAAGWRGKGGAALLVAQGLRSGGAFRYFDDNATPYNPDDDGFTTRRNNRTESLGLTGRLEQRAGPLDLSLTHDLTRTSRGVPGTGADPSLHSRYRADRGITNLLVGWRGGEAPGAPNPFVRLYAIVQRDRFDDRQGTLTGLVQATDDHTRKLGGAVQGERRLPLGAVLAAAFDERLERYEPSLVLPGPRTLPQSQRRVGQGGVELREAPVAWLELVGAVRRQTTNDDFGGGPPYPGALPVPARRRVTNQNQWNAGLRLGPSGLALKATIARLKRMPTLEELFGDRGGIYGNPNARPEDILTRDAGLVSFWSAGAAPRALPAWIESQLSAYRSDATDLLLFVQNSQRSSVAQNVSAARLEGLELSVRSGWRAGLLAELSWTRQWTRDEGEAVYWRGKELPGRPRDEALARLSLGRARWNASYEFHFVSRNFLDRYNASPVGPRSLHDVGLGFTPWPKGPEWTAECRNLTDSQTQDFAGFPLPGRVYYAGIRARIERKDQAHDAPLP